MLNLALKNIREISRDKKVLLSILFPGLILVFSHFLFKHEQAVLQDIPLAVVNPEPAFPKAGRLLVMALERMKPPKSNRPLFQVREMERNQALRLLHEKRVVGVLLISPNFTKGLQEEKKAQRIVLIINEGDERSRIAALELQSLVQKFGFMIEESKGKVSRQPVLLATVTREGRGLDQELEMLAYLSVFVFIYPLIYAAEQWVGEIERGSFIRFRMAGISVLELFLGSFLSILLLGIAQAVIFLLIAFQLGLRPYAFLFWIWPVAFVLLLASSGAGLIVSSFFEKEKQLMLFVGFMMAPLLIFSGPLGEQVGFARYLNYLPWHEGYAILTQALVYKVPDLSSFIAMTVSSVLLSCAGIGIFSLKRFRYV